jgi:hypothetical protein
MLTINLGNVEEMIFTDKKIQNLLPDLTHEFQQWQLGQQVPSLRNLGKRAIIDALNKLGQYSVILEEYFGTAITIETLDYKMIRDMSFDVGEAENELCKLDGFPNLAVSRIGNQLYVSIWR